MSKWGALGRGGVGGADGSGLNLCLTPGPGPSFVQQPLTSPQSRQSRAGAERMAGEVAVRLWSEADSPAVKHGF